MTYSYQQMEKLCLDLARDADPREADALRTVAANYRSAPAEQLQPDFKLRFRSMLVFVGVVYILFWTPLTLLHGGSPLRVEMPRGRVIEQISGFEPTADGRFQTRTYKFQLSKTYTADPAPLVVFEGAALMPPERYEFQGLGPQNVWRYVTITTSDGSNPSTNGRRYYAVLP